MAVRIRARWLQDGDIEVKDFPQDMEQGLMDLANSNPDHDYVCASTSGSDVVIKRMFDADMKVPDVYRYKIEKDGNLIVQRVGSDKNVLKECHLPTIVLLLESPHKDEYCNNRPIAPARGTTGRNLDSHLSGVLSPIRNRIFNGSRVIISNPVQFQTSLHMILESLKQSNLSEQDKKKLKEKFKDKENKCKVKDAVWRFFWERNHIQSHFAFRMKEYDPYIVINACTGEGGTGLNKKITDFLKNREICCEIYEIRHPSRWTIPKLRKI